MFTHQDPSVWAGLALIIWASGYCVKSAWVVSTETNSDLKKGSHVQGTVCLVLGKRSGGIDAWDSDLNNLPAEVKGQIELLQKIDASHGTAFDFSQADFQLAAYGAALKTLTGFSSYEGIEPNSVFEEGNLYKSEAHQKIVQVIQSAQLIADGLLVPNVFAGRKNLWEDLLGVEKYWVKSLVEIYSGGLDISLFQTIAKGFDFEAGDDYQMLFSKLTANGVEMKSPSEWGNAMLTQGAKGWRGSLTRQVFKAVSEVSASGDGMMGVRLLQEGLGSLSDKLPTIQTILRLIESANSFQLGQTWERDAKAAGLLANSLAQLNPATIGAFLVPELDIFRKTKPAKALPKENKGSRISKATSIDVASLNRPSEGIDSLLKSHRDENGDGVL